MNSFRVDCVWVCECVYERINETIFKTTMLRITEDKSL